MDFNASATLQEQDWPCVSAGETISTAPSRPVRHEALFTAIELKVLDMAWREGLRTIRAKGRVGQWVDRLFGLSRPNRLASDRLEGLRRFAILLRHGNGQVDEEEITRFIGAGFNCEQLEALHLALLGRPRLRAA